MNEQRRIVYKYRREVLEGKDMSGTAREELVEVVSRMVDNYTPGDVIEDWDLGELQTQVRQLWPSQVELSGLAARDDRPRDLREQLVADALAAYDPREQEFGDELMRQLERGDPASDHRQPLARASRRDGLPARGHPPARLRPDRPAGRLQERGLRHVRGADVRDLGGVRPPDLPRRGRGRPPSPGAVRRPRAPGRVEYSGGTAEQPSALGQAAVATASGADAAAEQAIEGTAQPPATAARRRSSTRPPSSRTTRRRSAATTLLVRLGQEVQEVPRRLVPEAGQEIEGFGGMRLLLVRTGAETGGELLEMEASYPGGTGGLPPAHLLPPVQLERFEALEGAMRTIIARRRAPLRGRRELRGPGGHDPPDGRRRHRRGCAGRSPWPAGPRSSSSASTARALAAPARWATPSSPSSKTSFAWPRTDRRAISGCGPGNCSTSDQAPFTTSWAIPSALFIAGL